MSNSDHDFGYPTGVHGRIPSFNNVEEEAEFWDTHDVTDYWDEGRPVRIVPTGELATLQTLRLDPADRAALERLAEAQGVDLFALVRMWVKERLQQEAAARSS